MTKVNAEISNSREEIEKENCVAGARKDEIKARESEIEKNSMKLNSLQSDKNEIYQKYGNGMK